MYNSSRSSICPSSLSLFFPSLLPSFPFVLLSFLFSLFLTSFSYFLPFLSDSFFTFSLSSRVFLYSLLSRSTFPSLIPPALLISHSTLSFSLSLFLFLSLSLSLSLSLFNPHSSFLSIIFFISSPFSNQLHSLSTSLIFCLFSSLIFLFTSLSSSSHSIQEILVM